MQKNDGKKGEPGSVNNNGDYNRDICSIRIESLGNDSMMMESTTG